MNAQAYAWYAFHWLVYIRPANTTDLDWFYSERGQEMRRAHV